MDFIEFIIPVLGAIVYSLVFMLKSQQDGEKLDVFKFATTAIIGFVIGVLMYGAGIPITEQDIGVQLVTYAGLTAIVESVLKIVWRAVKGQG